MASDELVLRGGRAALDRLDDAELARVVAELGPEGMQALVARVGLEDAGHWLALATPAQVLEVLDAELWRGEGPGGDEHFDPARFLAWLEALVEVDPAVAGDRLAEAPRELVVLGVFRRALVFDTDELWLAVARGLVDPAIDDQPQLEVGDFLVVGRDLEGWDALVSALAELADRHPTDADAILDRVRELTDRVVADQGLRDALLDEGEGEEEAALEREDRRSARGFVAPHAARSFLAFAVDVDLEAQRAHGGRDPVTAAYFRDWEGERPPVAAGLARAGLAGARAEELGYLVQVVLAGCAIGGRAPTLAEAADAVLAVCRVGEAVAGPAGTADLLFRVGYHVLHHRVVRRARALGDRAGLADDLPSLDGRYLSSLDDLARAEARLAEGRRAVTFEAEVLRDGLVEVPGEAAAALGANGATPVRCRVGEEEHRRTLKPWGDRWRLAVGAPAGTRIAVTLEPVDAALPVELEAALAADPALRDAWYALPAARQRAWADRVRAGAGPAARRRRAELVLARLRG